MARSSNDVGGPELPPLLPWSEFVAGLDWRQGEHVALIGPTGQGKTTLAMALLPLRAYVVAFATKPRDDTMADLIRTGGYVRMAKWSNGEASTEPRRVLWPDARRLDSKGTQVRVFHDALDRIYRAGRWCVYMDELYFLCNDLGLMREVKTYLTQARSLKISLVVATQRPSWVPLEIYDQSTHLFFWRDNDERNLRRLGGVSFLSADAVRHCVSRLDRHEVLYIDTRTGVMVRTKAPAPTPRRRARK
jgi:hypothetical protein